MKKKSNKRKKRNWLAIHAFQRSGAGHHGNKKKEQNKKACRKKIRL